MARISMKCKCGWGFFVSDSTQQWQVPCPSCGGEVPIPGRTPREGGPLSPGQVAAQKMKQQRTLMLLGATLGGIVIVVVALILLGGGDDREPEEAPAPRKTARTAAPSASSSGPDAAAAPEASDPAAPTIDDAPPAVTVVQSEVVPDRSEVKPVKVMADPKEIKRRIDRFINLANLAGVLAELKRHKSEVEEYEKLVKQMAQYETEIQDALAVLAERGDKHVLQPHLLPGDKIVWFAQKDFTQMKRGEVAGVLEGWLKIFQVGVQEACYVNRSGETITTYLYFSEKSKELVDLLAAAGINPDRAIPPPASSPQEVLQAIAVPADVVQKIRDRLGALPAGYLALVPSDERDRMGKLLEKGKGFPEDVEFLKVRVLGDILPVFEKEVSLIKAKMADLEPKLKGAASVDTVFFKDGGKIEGTVEEETDEFIKVRSRFGAIKRAKSEVARIERGKNPGVEFEERYKAAQGKADALVPLLAWCKEKRLALHKDYVAYVLLAADPLQRDALAELTDIARERAASNPAVRNQSVAKRIEELAVEILKGKETLSDVLEEMRKRTDGLRYTMPVSVPEKFSKAAVIIQDPLEFRANSIPMQAALELGGWWSPLTLDERSDFVRFYGLWCAFRRASGAAR